MIYFMLWLIFEIRFVLIYKWLVFKWFCEILIQPPLRILSVQKMELELGSFEEALQLEEGPKI
jgi:hypothetical protein